jgi:hypothetical protein
MAAGAHCGFICGWITQSHRPRGPAMLQLGGKPRHKRPAGLKRGRKNGKNNGTDSKGKNRQTS